MISKEVDRYLEERNMTYLFLMLANLEVARISNLPEHIKKHFDKKITELSLLHVVKNEIPDYIVEEFATPTGENRPE
jgi:hypothetical protein